MSFLAKTKGKRAQRAQRRMTSLKAQIRRGQDWAELPISNISTTGFMAKSQEPPEVGSEVEVRHRGTCISGEVVWATATRFGVRSFEKIDVEALLARSGLGDEKTSVEEVRHDPRWWHWQTWR